MSLGQKITLIKTIHLGTSLWNTLGCFLQQLTDLPNGRMKINLLQNIKKSKAQDVTEALRNLNSCLQICQEKLLSLTALSEDYCVGEKCEHSKKFAERALGNFLETSRSLTRKKSDKFVFGKLLSR